MWIRFSSLQSKKELRTARSPYVPDEADLFGQRQLPGEPNWRPHSAVSHIFQSASTFQCIKNTRAQFWRLHTIPGKADTTSRTKTTGTGDPPHTLLEPPTTAMHSILTLSSQSFRLPEKDAPGFRTPLRPCPRQVGSAWELGSPPFTIYLPFGKVDSGAFLNLISQFSHRVEF